MKLELLRALEAIYADCGHKIHSGGVYLKADNQGAVRYHCTDCGLALMTLATMALRVHERVWTEGL